MTGRPDRRESVVVACGRRTRAAWDNLAEAVGLLGDHCRFVLRKAVGDGRRVLLSRYNHLGRVMLPSDPVQGPDSPGRPT